MKQFMITQRGTEQVEYIFLADLAEQLNLDRSFLLKKAKREHIEIIKLPRMTDGGAHNLSAVPCTWANKVSTFYKAARENEGDA